MGWASSQCCAAAVKTALAILGLLLATAAALLALGRSPICPCGTVRLWHGTVQSAENSQQLLDWYSLTHLVHGLLFYMAGAFLLRRWPVQRRLIAAVSAEAAWEILENSPIIIDRYRAVTMAWGYAGDSTVNSLSDIGCMSLGFVLAWRLPWRASILLGAGCELLALLVIRDNLALNVLMLVWPIEAVRVWQAG